MYVVYHVLYIGNWPKCLGILILLFLLASQQRICSLYSLILYCVTMDQKQHNIDRSKGAQLDHKVPIFALVLKYQSTVLRLRPLYIVDLSPYAKGDYFIQKSSQLFLKIGTQLLVSIFKLSLYAYMKYSTWAYQVDMSNIIINKLGS